MKESASILTISSISEYNWPSEDYGVWRRLAYFSIVHAKSSKDAKSLFINYKTSKEEKFIVYGHLLARPGSMHPNIYVHVEVSSHAVDFGHHQNDANRGLWLCSLDNSWYRLEEPANEFKKVALKDLDIVKNFLRVYDAIKLSSGPYCSKYDHTHDLVCNSSIQDIYHYIGSFSLKFVFNHKTFVLDNLNTRIDLENSLQLTRSIEDLELCNDDEPDYINVEQSDEGEYEPPEKPILRKHKETTEIINNIRPPSPDTLQPIRKKKPNPDLDDILPITTNEVITVSNIPDNFRAQTLGREHNKVTPRDRVLQDNRTRSVQPLSRPAPKVCDPIDMANSLMRSRYAPAPAASSSSSSPRMSQQQQQVQAQQLNSQRDNPFLARSLQPLQQNFQSLDMGVTASYGTPAPPKSVMKALTCLPLVADTPSDHVVHHNRHVSFSIPEDSA